MSLDYSSTPLEIRAWEDERTFTARVCNYGVVDSKGTSWKPGVFTRSLANKLPKAVWSHEWNRPIGKVTSYRDSDEGLDVTVQLADFARVPDADMAHSLLKDGIIDEFSFGFYRQADMPDPDHKGAMMITEATIKEVSPVLVGSVPGTRTLAVRADDGTVDVVEQPILLNFSDEEMTALRKLIGSERAAQVTELRDTVTEASIPKNSNGQLASMKRTPHKYSPTTGDGSVCKVCGAQQDTKAHTRADSTAEIRDLAISMAADPTEDTDTNDLISACDAAVDAAIALASYQDMTNLPPWVAQMLALVMAADAAIDAAIDQLGLPDPDEADDNIMARSLQPVEVREAEPEVDAEIQASIRSDLDRLETLGRRR